MVPTSDALGRLDEAEIRACHWKSNWALPTIEGATDIDLLILRRTRGASATS
jgi:hypothetical protein